MFVFGFWWLVALQHSCLPCLSVFGGWRRWVVGLRLSAVGSLAALMPSFVVNIRRLAAISCWVSAFGGWRRCTSHPFLVCRYSAVGGGWLLGFGFRRLVALQHSSLPCLSVFGGWRRSVGRFRLSAVGSLAALIPSLFVGIRRLKAMGCWVSAFDGW